MEFQESVPQYFHLQYKCLPFEMQGVTSDCEMINRKSAEKKTFMLHTITFV